jgi:hypothetical protein
LEDSASSTANTKILCFTISNLNVCLDGEQLLRSLTTPFVYCPGKQNSIAEMLSRYPMTAVTTFVFEEVTTLQELSFPATTFRIIQSQALIPTLKKKPHDSNVYSLLKKEGSDIICRNNKIVVDPILFDDILLWYHTTLNQTGQDWTYTTI